MRFDTPIAYYPPDEGTILCPDCARLRDDTDTFGVSFPGDEVDCPPTCDDCACVIPDFTLTTDGIDYMREMMAESLDRWHRTVDIDTITLGALMDDALTGWYNARMLLAYAEQTTL